MANTKVEGKHVASARAVYEPPSLRYMFDISASVKSTWVGATPEGDRLDIQYGGSESSTLTTNTSRFARDWLKPLDPHWIKELAALVTDAGFPVDPSKDASREGLAAALFAFRQLDPNNLTNNAAIDALNQLAGNYTLPLAWFGFTGGIVTGSDWAIVRQDAVAVFSAQLTLRSADPDKALIDATFGGAVDLVPPPDPKWAANALLFTPDQRNDTYEAWQSGSGKKIQKIMLTATFGASIAAQTWAPRRYLDQSKGFWKYQHLTRAQFVAIGDAHVEHENYSPLTKIKLSLYELRQP